uniref:Uncharacterized protein n=1 Tax=Strongyloides papillosus TaxID=174720 RepID=A0A0N5CJ03_STREA
MYGTISNNLQNASVAIPLVCDEFSEKQCLYAYDDEATRLLKKRCSEIIEIFKNYEDNKKDRNREITANVINKAYNFKVQVESRSGKKWTIRNFKLL